MTTEFADVKMDDGTIRDIVILDKGGVTVRILKWDDSYLSVRFADPVAILVNYPIAQDLTHPSVSTEDPLIRTACEKMGESADGYRCFGLVSSWSGETMVKVVAREAIVSEG